MEPIWVGGRGACLLAGWLLCGFGVWVLFSASSVRSVRWLCVWCVLRLAVVRSAAVRVLVLVVFGLCAGDAVPERVSMAGVRR